MDWINYFALILRIQSLKIYVGVYDVQLPILKRKAQIWKICCQIAGSLMVSNMLLFFCDFY